MLLNLWVETPSGVKEPICRGHPRPWPAGPSECALPPLVCLGWRRVHSEDPELPHHQHRRRLHRAQHGPGGGGCGGESEVEE